MKEFPRTEIEGVSLPRILIGTNWVLGYSHRSPSADTMIRKKYHNKETVSSLLEAYMEYSIDAVMAPIMENSILLDGIHMAEDRTGKKITIIDTPIIDVSDTKEGRLEAYRQI